MKKFVSILIATVIVLSSFVTVFAVPLNEKQESAELNGFIDGIVSLAREYDADKEFTVDENSETEQIQHFSAQNTAEEKDSNAEPKYTLQDFQTARLIVRADDRFNDCDALEHVSGFEDFHILQYESPEAAMAAFEQLQSEKNITEVTPDVVCTYCGYESTPDNPDIIEKDEFLNDWSRDRTQSKRLQEYLAESDIPMKEIVVGVVDTGIDYNHEIYEGRVKRTYFNSSPSGNANDEMDSEMFYHGTTTSSIIINNSPKNVKVAVYKVSDNNDDLTVTAICAGLLKAIEKQSDIINISLVSSSDQSLITECVLKAYSENIPIFAPVGNYGTLDSNLMPANIPECIAVSATDFNNTTTFMNSLTPNSDISAPGEDIATAIPGNRYARFSGTSYSSPYAAALGAILKSITPEIKVNEIEARLKETSFDVKRYNESKSSQGDYMDSYYSLYDGVGMIQFCDALGLEKLVAPKMNLEDNVYVGEQTCTITCPNEDATVLYTTDGTYPDFENAVIYTEPFQITQRTRIRSVAYYADGGYYSDEVEATPRIQYTDSDENFVIDNDGIIKRYTGNVSDLFVPETINGITVTRFVKGVFNNVIGLTLPETVTEIPTGAFSKNSIIEFVCGEGVVTVKSSAFSQSNIMNVNFPAAKYIQGNAFYLASKFCNGYFPNVETIDGGAFANSRIISFYGPNVREIEDGAFIHCSRLETVYFPQCIKIKKNWSANGLFDSCTRLIDVEMPHIANLTANAFNGTAISKADFPFVETIREKTFYDCQRLEYINMPSLLSVPKQAFNAYYCSEIIKPRIYYLDSVTQIGQDAFGTYLTSRLELSHLETAKSLPQTEGCIISMPSTFSECTEDTAGRNYKIYGTKGTYAERWANKNGHEFIEISQDTAVLTQLPMQYTDTDETLTADVIGFNRTYQWYANDKADNTTGTAIEGATGRDFNPADYPAKYYYCVVTSTDVGYDPIEIRTGVTENKTLKSADYSAYDAAVLKANALEREYYKDLTALDAALAVDVSGLTALEQDIVDAQTKAIEEALTALEFKDADYSAYNAAVEKANALDKSLYADTTELDNLLAENISGLTILNQDIVDTQTKAIEEALKNLVFKPADYTEVEKAKSEIPEDLSVYTDESVSALQEALNSVDYSLNITEQATVDGYAKAITEAVNALEYKPADYTEYDKAVEQANEIDRSLYKDLTALDEALSVDVSGRNITEQNVVDAQTQAILEALNGLEEKPVSPTVPEEPTQSNQTEPSVPDETTKPNTPEETTSSDIQKVDIPKTGGVTSISCTVAFLTLLSACVYITSRKRKVI